MRARLKPSSANGLAFSLQAENATEQALLVSLTNHPNLTITAQPDGSVLLSAAVASISQTGTCECGLPNVGRIGPCTALRQHKGRVRRYVCLKCSHEQEHATGAFRPGTAPLCTECQGVLKRIRDHGCFGEVTGPSGRAASPASPQNADARGSVAQPRCATKPAGATRSST